MHYVKVIMSGAKSIAAGSRHSMVLKHDGSVWATGYNLHGQLGDGLATNSKVFVTVLSEGATAVAAGAFHSMVLMRDGSVRATGSNKDGQFGDGSTNSEKSFVRVAEIGNGAEHGTIANKWVLICSHNFIHATYLFDAFCSCFYLLASLLPQKWM